MTHKPEHWTETDLGYTDLTPELMLAQAGGWVFFEHPELGDEHPVLAASLDFLGENGPVIYNTRDFDVPEVL